MVMLDIDHFKKFNDVFGHEAGDVLLSELGGFLKINVRGSDVACRYGGEEFTLILPESPPETVLKRAEQIREKAKLLVVQHGDHVLGPITLSMGISMYPQNGQTSADLLRVADAALYRAKEEGRDRVVTG